MRHVPVLIFPNDNVGEGPAIFRRNSLVDIAVQMRRLCLVNQGSGSRVSPDCYT